ncbi:MAG: leucine-rich repeat protein [Clostridiaceae bacterium]|nr:leucine-rich repeat protein [Clostridiaceae bacterium]
MSNKYWTKNIALCLSLIMILSLFSPMFAWADEEFKLDLTGVLNQETVTATVYENNEIEFFQQDSVGREALEVATDVPSIETNLQSMTTKVDKITFDLWAKDSDGQKISTKDIKVTNNNQIVGVTWEDSEKISYTANLNFGENEIVIEVNYGGEKHRKTFTIEREVANDGEVIGEFVFSLEAFTVGLGYLIEPVIVDLHMGRNAAEELVEIIEAAGYEYENTGTVKSGFYLSQVLDGSEKVYKTKPTIPEVLKEKLNGNYNETQYWEGELGEFAFNSMSGWMYAVNNTFPNVGFSDQYLLDEDVMRVQFTLALGNDIGGSVGGGSANQFFTKVNKDELTRAIAVINSSRKKEELLSNQDVLTAYNHSYEILQRLDVSQAEIDTAKKNLEEALSGNNRPEIDKKALESKIAEAKLLEENVYTEETWNELLQVISEAEAVAENENAMQEEVDLAIAAIKESIEKLVEKQAEISLTPREQLNKNLDYIYETVDNPTFGTGAGEWSILCLARGGYQVEEGYYALYYENVEEEVKKLMEINPIGKLDRNKGTEHSRLILGLTSIGKDITNVSGYDIRGALADFDYVIRQGINGPIFALIALDSHQYEIPVDENVENQTTREKCIAYILDREIAGGGWALTGNIPDPDITAMAIQGLTPYYESKPQVKAAVDRAITWLSENQRDDGGYSSWGSINSESCAQVIVALTGLGIDPHKDERFIKNGISAVDNLMSFAVPEGGFMHVKPGGNTDGGAEAGVVDGMATDQGTYALIAYDRFVNGKNSLYDMTDVVIEIPVPPTDKSDLQDKIEEVNTLAEADYTEVTWEALKTALTAAQTVLADEEATLAEVDEALTNLTNAIEALKEIEGTINKTALEAAKAAAAEKAEEDYTEASYAALVAALALSETIQEEVDAKVVAIHEAIEGLQKRTPGVEGAEIDVNIAVVGIYHEILYSPQQITIIYEGDKVTAEDALKATGLSLDIKDNGWIESIEGQKNGEDDGNYHAQSGWMYKVNFMVPNDVARKEEIKAGDYIFFYYAKSSHDLLPSFDSYQNDFVTVTVEGKNNENVIDFSESVTVLKKDSIFAAIMVALNKNNIGFDKDYLKMDYLMTDDWHFWSFILNDDIETYNDAKLQLEDGDTIRIFKDMGEGPPKLEEDTSKEDGEKEIVFEFDEETGTIKGYKGNRPPENLVIPKEINGVAVRKIGEKAFHYSSFGGKIDTQIKTVELPEGLDIIGPWAFQGNLIENLVIPNSVTKIKERGFWGNEIEALTFSANLVEIGDGAFERNNLTSIVVPQKVKSIGDSAFRDNYLESVVLPEGLEKIGANTFTFNALDELVIPESVTEFPSNGRVLWRSNTKQEDEVQRYTRVYNNGNATDENTQGIVNPTAVKINYVNESEEKIHPSIEAVGRELYKLALREEGWSTIEEIVGGNQKYLQDYKTSTNTYRDYNHTSELGQNYFRVGNTYNFHPKQIGGYEKPEEINLKLEEKENEITFVYKSLGNKNLTLEGEGLTSNPEAGEVGINSEVSVVINPPFGKEIESLKVNGEEKSHELKFHHLAYIYIFNLVEDTTIEVTYKEASIDYEKELEVQLDKKTVSLGEKISIDLLYRGELVENLIEGIVWEVNDEDSISIDFQTGEIIPIKSGDISITARLKSRNQIKDTVEINIGSFTSKVRVESHDRTIVPLTELKINNLDLSYYNISTEFEEVKPIHAIIKALESVGIDCTDSENGFEHGSGSYISMIDGIKGMSEEYDYWNGWMYYVENQYADKGINEFTIKPQETIVVFHVENFMEYQYSFFDKDKSTISVRENLELNLMGSSGAALEGIEEINPIANATILVNDKPYKVNGELLKTDEKGNVVLSFEDSGRYIISAKKENIVRPYAEILVEEELEESNTEKLGEALNKVVAYYKENQPQTPMVGWEAFIALWGAGVDFKEDPWEDYLWKTQDPGFDAMTSGNDHIHHIFSLLSVGENPAKAFESNRNLFVELSSHQKEDGSFGTIGKHIWSIVALDVAAEIGIDIGEWEEKNRGKAIEALIKQQNLNGSFGPFSQIDNTGWALIPLSKGSGEIVEESITKAKSYLKTMQVESGGFGGTGMWDTENSNSIACVIQGLIAVGEDISDVNGQWSKNGKTPIDALLSYQNEDGSFNWQHGESGSVGMATKQVAVALSDMVRSQSTWYELCEIQLEIPAPPVDKADLQDKIAVAEELKEVEYTEATWEVLQIALKAATEVVAKEEATQEEVDTKVAAIEAAITGLVEKIDPEETEEPKESEDPEKLLEIELREADEDGKIDLSRVEELKGVIQENGKRVTKPVIVPIKVKELEKEIKIQLPSLTLGEDEALVLKVKAANVGLARPVTALEIIVPGLGKKEVTLTLPIPKELNNKKISGFHKAKEEEKWEYREATVDKDGNATFTTDLSTVLIGEAIEVPKLKVVSTNSSSVVFEVDSSIEEVSFEFYKNNERIKDKDITEKDGKYIIKGLNASMEYTFKATAIDEEGFESALSNSVRVETDSISSGGGSSSGSSSSRRRNKTATSTETVKSSESTTIKQEGATLKFPRNTMDRDFEVIIERVNNVSRLPMDSNRKIVGEVFEITKNKTGNFDKNITVMLPFDESEVDFDKYDVSLFWLNEKTNEWLELDKVKVNKSNGNVSGEIDHFTKFAILATEKKTKEVIEAKLIDIAGHWAEESIIKLIEMEAINGYLDDTFKPENNITRGEFATVLVRALDLEVGFGKVFADTEEHWAKDYIATAYEQGILKGYDENAFGANDYITREQMAVMVIKAIKLEGSVEENTFIDEKDISDWAKSAVDTAIENNIITGYPDNTFRPQSYATRAEAVMVITKIAQ